jgi:hypothetical protein
MRIHISVLLTLLTALVLLVPRVTLASCVPLTDQQRYDQADIVGLARVVDVRREEVQVEITRLFKGDRGTAITISNPNAPAVTSVDVPWEQGRVFLAYLEQNEAGEFTTNVCNGTRRFDGSLTAGERRSFGLTAQDLAVTPNTQATNRDSFNPWLLAGAGLVALLTGTFLARAAARH